MAESHAWALPAILLVSVVGNYLQRWYGRRQLGVSYEVTDVEFCQELPFPYEGDLADIAYARNLVGYWFYISGKRLRPQMSFRIVKRYMDGAFGIGINELWTDLEEIYAKANLAPPTFEEETVGELIVSIALARRVSRQASVLIY